MASPPRARKRARRGDQALPVAGVVDDQRMVAGFAKTRLLAAYFMHVYGWFEAMSDFVVAVFEPAATIDSICCR